MSTVTLGSHRIVRGTADRTGGLGALKLPGAMACLFVVLLLSTAAGQGRLGELRDDVRRLPTAAAPAPPPPPPEEKKEPAVVDHAHHDHDGYGSHDDHGWDLGTALGAGYLVAAGVTSPFWGPHAAIDEGFATEYLFPRFPYDGVPGYMTGAWGFGQKTPRDEPAYMKLDVGNTRLRRWSARVRAEYADDFNDLHRLGGHLLLSTSSRWGLDTEMGRLREGLPNGARDQIWIGDCNLVFRFAQSERMQWRTGLGLNWLDDPAATDFGFNFTYGMDYFPRRPWVISSTLDWGTLGHAELFRYRATVGVIVRGIEAFTGYEYLDVDRTQIGSLLGGVRIWF